MRYDVSNTAQTIKEISRDTGLTYGQMAKKLGRSKSCVAHWANNQPIPLMSMLELCEVFDKEITDFVKEI